MSADSFKVFIGLRFDIDFTNEDKMEKIENGTDARIELAKKAGLEYFTGGRDEEDDHLFIGQAIDTFGWEYNSHRQMDVTQLSETYKNISEKMSSVGFNETPQIHFQFFGNQ